MLTDVWAELEAVFGLHIDDIYPGIQASGLDRELQKSILHHLLKQVHDIEPMLEDIYTGRAIVPQTVDGIVNSLLSNRTDGMVWVETAIDNLVLPQLGLFVPDESHLSIHYIMGMWSPVTLIGLFELLRWIQDLDEHILIQMEEETAPLPILLQFNTTWQAYLADEANL